MIPVWKNKAQMDSRQTVRSVWHEGVDAAEDLWRVWVIFPSHVYHEGSLSKKMRLNLVTLNNGHLVCFSKQVDIIFDEKIKSHTRYLLLMQTKLGFCQQHLQTSLPIY